VRPGAARAALALLAMLAGAAAAEPGEERIAEFDIGDFEVLPEGVGEIEPFRSWTKAFEAQPARRSAAAVAAALAPGSGLAEPQMRELVELWRAVRAASAGLPDSDAQLSARRARFAALLAASGRSPLVLQAAAAAEGATLECRPDAFTAYLEGSSDRESEGWALARTADCAPWFRSYIAVAAAKAALPLLKLADAGEMKGGSGMAVLEALASEKRLARFQADDPEALRGRLGALYLQLLLDSGLVEEAVAYHESVPAEVRSKMFERVRDPLEVRADGLSVTLDGDDVDGDLATDLVAAYALARPATAAERLFAEAQGPERVRRLKSCLEPVDATKPPADCRRDHGAHDEVLLFADHILHGGDSDPYPLAEMLVASHSYDAEGLMIELRCRVFRAAAYASLCEEGRKYAAYAGYVEGDAENRAAAVGGLAALGAPAGSVDVFERRLRAVYPPKTASPEPRRRASVDPLPSQFEERRLPSGLKGIGKPRPQGLAPLPNGYHLIRAESLGARAVAISASQNYDPTGEVSLGGYWVHLSEDGGRSWQRPLFTGLADRFPYVVLSRSPLPLLDGDSINLAVDVNLLDTATITYPPIGIRSRDRRSGLYLRIPLEALRTDSDQDGLSDIAARHLLLDPASMAGGTPVRLDGNGEACSREEMQAQEPLRMLLEHAFGQDSGAVMEPLDRKSDPFVMGDRVDVASFDRPMLIRGDPADFRCLRSRRLTVVYGEKDVERLQRMSPDFHPVEIRRILFNRARDRGYASWSAEWTGGTVRFRRTAAGWTSEAISRWVS
jgi:hypothetical protein